MFIYLLLISIPNFQAIEYFTDSNFQKRTLISKHNIQYNWIVAYCEQECSNNTINILNSYGDDYQKGLVNLSQNPWIKNNLHNTSIWIYYQNNTMCNIQDCSKLHEIPQVYNIPKSNFFEFRLLDVQIGCLILIVFYILAFRDLKERFWNKKHKQD